MLYKYGVTSECTSYELNELSLETEEIESAEDSESTVSKIFQRP